MASTTTTPPQLRLYLHSEISTSHLAHGVTPHEDYSQYTAYCTRRLHRLRHIKQVKKDLVHVRLYKSSLSTKIIDTTTTNNPTGKNARKYAYRAIDLINLPSEQLASHVNYFLEPLYCAERCWANSLALKAEMNAVMDNHNTDNNNNQSSALGNDKGNPRKEWSLGKFRAQSLKRLKKAVKYAELVESLALSTKAAPSNDDGEEKTAEEKEDNNTADDESNIVQPPVDEHTQMEARAYASFMRGNLALEMNQWQMACSEYQMAMQLCEALGQGATASGGTDDNGNVDVQQLELFDFFNSRAKNVIAPLLKYCHYELQVSTYTRLMIICMN